jgi:hypothetical protein
VNRLDEIERKVNAKGIDSAARPAAAKRFAEQKSLDGRMKRGEPVGEEIKSLDSDLKVQDVFVSPTAQRDFPLLALVDSRPTNADTPNFGFPADAAIRIKGREGSSQIEQVWKKSTATVETYDYQPTLLSEDVADAGAWLLDDAARAAVDGVRGTLCGQIVGKIEAAAKDPAGMGFDPYKDVALLVTAGASLAEVDLLAAIAAIPLRFRRGAAWVGSPTMTARVRGLTDAGTGARLWAPSIAVGTPATLYGFPYIEDESVDADKLLFGNPQAGSGVAARQQPTLLTMERLNGDYKPYFQGRFGVCVKDARAWTVTELQGT